MPGAQRAEPFRAMYGQACIDDIRGAVRDITADDADGGGARMAGSCKAASEIVRPGVAIEASPGERGIDVCIQPGIDMDRRVTISPGTLSRTAADLSSG